MAAQTDKTTRHTSAADTSLAVDTFLSKLEHPHRAEVLRLRQLILAADPAIRDGIKWNAPSYRTHEYFATTHLRARAGVGLILHLGAKAKASDGAGLDIPDPQGLLQWLAKDRAMVVFKDGVDLESKAEALTALIQAWIQHV